MPQSLLRSSLLFMSSTLLASPAFAAVPERDAAKDYARWPLRFEKNQGQSRDDVRFSARGSGYGVYLTANEAVLVLSPTASPAAEAGDGNAKGHCTADDATPQKSRALRMSLVGGAKTPSVSGLDEQRGKANYFIGDDTSQWRANIPTYAKVRYDEVYPGVDLVYHGNQRQLEYDFLLAPGANPRNIELRFDGAERVEIDTNGALVLHACGREIRQPKPVVYQEAGGRREVAGRYVHKGKNRIGFAVAAYDRSLPLVIDPLVLSYATYFGGSSTSGGSFELGNDIAVDAHGSVYVAGQTGAADLPVTPGAYQTSYGGAFVAKFDSAGSLVYSTYLGGSGSAFGQGIAVDHDGNAYVLGIAFAQSFPTTPGAFQQASSFGSYVVPFVTKLNPTGSALVYSTLLGGHGTDQAGDIAVDASGSVYVTGTAASTDFPTTPGAFQQPGGQIFISKLNAAGSALDYSSRFGTGLGFAIALDSGGNAYVTGITDSDRFPVTTGAFQTFFRGVTDAFVTKLSPLGHLEYSTYLGGPHRDTGLGIAVDSAGNAYVTGGSTLAGFPTTPQAYRATPGAGFVTKLNPSGSGMVYSTYLAGIARDIVVDAAGRAYVAGGDDDFVTIVEPSGSWVNVSGIHHGSGSAHGSLGIDRNPAANANVWVVGYTNSNDFPVTPNAYQPRRAPGGNASTGDDSDAFVMKLSPGATAIPGTIEADGFDEGGEGVGYHDNTPGNQGDAGSRTGEDVDLFVSNDAAGSPRIVKNFEAGEWLAYTISVPANGNYAIELRASTNFYFPNPAYHVEIDGVNATGTVVLPDTGGWDNYQWIGRKTVTLMAGTHVLKLVSERAYFGLAAIRVATAVTSAPYFRAPTAIPGEIEAEVFDAGGEGIAYHDNAPGNQGDAGFRGGEDVDVFAANDAGSGSWYIVKNFEASEWLAYTISVPTGGDYDIMLRASTSADFPNPAYHVEVDGTNATGSVVLPSTGGWDQYQWIGKKTVTLPAGIHVLKLVSERPYFGLNTIRVTPTAAPMSRAYFGTPIAVPGVFEAEAFDQGGEGVAYHEKTQGNQGDSGFRAVDTDVDIFITNDATSGSPYVVKNFEAGEWLAYTIDVPAGGNYDIELRAATNLAFPNSAYHIEVDGTDATGTVVLPDTGGWDNYRWLGTRTIPLTAGVHVLAVVVDQPYFGFNSLRVLESSR